MADGKGIIAELEQRFHLPSLTRVAETLQNFPNEKQIKLLRQTLEVAERISKTAPELNQVQGLIKAINEIPTEKLEQLDKLLRRLEKIIKAAPPEIMDMLRDIIKEG